MAPELGILNIDIKQSLGGKPKLGKLKSLESINKTQTNAIENYIKNPSVVKMTQDYTISDYEELKDKAEKGLDVDLISQLNLPEDIKDSLTLSVTDFNQKLMGLIPQNITQTLFGVDVRDPSDFEKSKFVRAMRVVEDPSVVLNQMQAGMIGSWEVEVLQDMYPDYYVNLEGNVVEAITNMKGEADKELTLEQNNSLGTLLGISRLTPAILQQKQEPIKADIKTPEGESTEVSRVSQGK